MAKKKAPRRYKTGPKKGKIIPRTPQQKRFATVARAANIVCHRETASVPKYKDCMSREMSKNLGKGKGKAAAKKTSAGMKSACEGLRKSGPNKGKLKPGYTWKGATGRKGFKCPRPV